jgi:3-oxoacyl-(acyl-carrier-protein) synthase
MCPETRAIWFNGIQGAKKISPLFVPRLLINLAAGHISMKYGLKVLFLSMLSLDAWSPY